MPNDVDETLEQATKNATAQKSGCVGRRRTLLLVALVGILFVVTAYAVSKMYSVRDYQAGGNPSPAFEEKIVELNRTCENENLAYTLTDAVFDGQSIALAMDIQMKETDKQVYMYPKLSAYQ